MDANACSACNGGCYVGAAYLCNACCTWGYGGCILVDKYILSRKTGNNNKPSRSVAPGNFVNSFGQLQAGHDSTSSPQKDTGYSIVRQGNDPQKKGNTKG